MKSAKLYKNKIVIVIPTLNEKENIKKLISSLIKLISNALIIVVDDNSQDGTNTEVKKLQQRYKNIHLIERKGKLGRGSAVMAGFLYAFNQTKAEMFVEMDADLSHNPTELPKLIAKADNDVVVIGSRYLSKSRIYGWPIQRRIFSKFANSLIHRLLKIPIHDCTNGYRIYNRNAVSVLLEHTFITRGHILLSESIALLHKKHFKFVEVSTIFVNRKVGNSKVGTNEVIQSFIGIFRIKQQFDNKTN
jgi:dolichol-phosphate mannosyltransferase